LVYEEAKQENGIILVIKEKEVKSKLALKVVLPIVPQSNPYLLHCPNLGIEVHISKEALLLFSMCKLRNKAIYDKAIYDVFYVDAEYLFFGRPLKFGPKIVFHERLIFKFQTLTLGLLNSAQPQTLQKLKLHN